MSKIYRILFFSSVVRALQTTKIDCQLELGFLTTSNCCQHLFGSESVAYGCAISDIAEDDYEDSVMTTKCMQVRAATNTMEEQVYMMQCPHKDSHFGHKLKAQCHGNTGLCLPILGNDDGDQPTLSSSRNQPQSVPLAQTVSRYQKTQVKATNTFQSRQKHKLLKRAAVEESTPVEQWTNKNKCFDYSADRGWVEVP